MRRAVFVSFFACAAACAISESGLLPDVDAGAEAGIDVVQPCATLDAACLGALDPSWKPVALASGNCPPDFTLEILKTNPRDVQGSCACGACSTIGSFACDAGVPISGGDNNCGDSPFVTVPPGVCTNVTPTQHFRPHAVNATGTVGCFAPNDAGAGAVTDDVALCVPGCAADFCGGASRCVMAPGEIGCPSGFQLFARVGTGADPGCAPCACEAGAPGACGGSATAYFNDGCLSTDDAGVYGIETCNYISQQYKSVRVDLIAPDASCAVTGEGAGDASLVGEMTVCCQ